MEPIASNALTTVEPYQEEYWYLWDTTSKVAGLIFTPFSLLSAGYCWLTGTHSRPAPPSAPGHCLLGSLPELAARNYSLLPFLRSYEKTYGEEGVCKLKIGPKVFYIVSEPKIASRILKNPSAFGRGDSLRVWREFSPGGLDEGEDTQKWRGQANKAIGRDHFAHYFPSVRQVAKCWTERLEGFADCGLPVDIMMEAERAALAAIGESLFKIDPHNLKEENPFSLEAKNDEKCFRFLTAFHNLFGLITTRLSSSLANIPYVGDHLYNTAYSNESQEMERAKWVLKSILKPIYENLLKDPDSISSDSHFAQLMHNFGIDIYNPDYDTILDHSLGFLQATFETSSKALGWTLYTLSQHPEIQTRLIEELHEAFGDTPPKSHEELKKVPYLFQVIEETLRLFPPFPFLLRDIKDPDAFKDYQVNKGETFIISPFFVHRNEAYWPDPETYNPERFTEEMLKDTWQVRHPEYLTFLAGIHRCPGRFFAKQELALLLTQFFLNFKVEIDETAPPPDFKFCITLQSSVPIQLVISKQK